MCRQSMTAAVLSFLYCRVMRGISFSLKVSWALHTKIPIYVFLIRLGLKSSFEAIYTIRTPRSMLICCTLKNMSICRMSGFVSLKLLCSLAYSLFLTTHTHLDIHFLLILRNDITTAWNRLGLAETEHIVELLKWSLPLWLSACSPFDLTSKSPAPSSTLPPNL